jgi:hypothetical protein
VATAALDDCMITVISKPAPTSASVANKPPSPPLGVRSRSSCPMPSCITSMPTKISPNPAIARPSRARRPCVTSRTSAPTPTNGNATVLTFTFRPIAETIHAVDVVPTLAPRMRPSDSLNVSNPALTNPTVTRVVALDDCTVAVTAAPVSRP